MNPIFGTDLSLESSRIVEGVRRELAQQRGRLFDLYHARPGWRDSLDTAEQGLTLVISYLYTVKQEMEQHEQRFRRPTPRYL